MKKSINNKVFSYLSLGIEMYMLNNSSRKYICHDLTFLSVAIIEDKLLDKRITAKYFNIFLSN